MATKPSNTWIPVSGPPVKVIGKDAYQAERVARTDACSPNPIATLLEKGPGFEVYSIPCSSGETRTYRCEFGNCAASSTK
jgi:hypothetical protein